MDGYGTVTWNLLLMETMLYVEKLFYPVQFIKSNFFHDSLFFFLISCGDILLEVNAKSTWGMTHTALVRLLKELRGRITLTIVSWPGSLL